MPPDDSSEGQQVAVMETLISVRMTSDVNGSFYGEVKK